MNVKLTSLLVLFLILLGGNAGHSQSKFKWPKDSAKAKEMYALYTDALREKDYSDALVPIRWLLENAPGLNLSIYIHGDKIYENLVRVEEDSSQKQQLQEQHLSLYDQRAEYFNDQGKVINRKAYTAYRYFRNRPAKYEELFHLFENAFSFEEKHILKANLVAYMNVIRLYKSGGGNLDDKQVIERYHLISSLVEVKGLKTKSQEIVDRLLASTVKIKCDMIEHEFSKSYRKDTSDIALAKRIMQLGLTYDCKELPIFLMATETVQRAEPSSALALMLGAILDKKGDKLKAEKYFHQATVLSPGDDKKAKAFYNLALHYQRREMKKQSRTAALECLKHNPSMLKAYKLIGDLYWTSVEDCQLKKSRTYDRAFYIAAYEMYKKAGDTSMMQQSRRQFPSIDDIFYEDKKEGQELHLGCWIEEDVVLQRRPGMD